MHGFFIAGGIGVHTLPPLPSPRSCNIEMDASTDSEGLLIAVHLFISAVSCHPIHVTKALRVHCPPTRAASTIGPVGQRLGALALVGLSSCIPRTLVPGCSPGC